MKYSKLYPSLKNSKPEDGKSNQMITEQNNRIGKEGATLRYVKLPHNGSVNRVRTKNVNEHTFCSSWSENGNVYIWDLSKALKAITSDKLANSFDTRSVEPVFTFKGHSKEGFALDWSSTNLGALASGDQNGKIYVWNSNEMNGWNVNSNPLTGHTDSVEGILSLKI